MATVNMIIDDDHKLVGKGQFLSMLLTIACIVIKLILTVLTIYMTYNNYVLYY